MSDRPNRLFELDESRCTCGTRTPGWHQPECPAMVFKLDDPEFEAQIRKRIREAMGSPVQPTTPAIQVVSALPAEFTEGLTEAQEQQVIQGASIALARFQAIWKGPHTAAAIAKLNQAMAELGLNEQTRLRLVPVLGEYAVALTRDCAENIPGFRELLAAWGNEHGVNFGGFWPPMPESDKDVPHD